MKPFHESLRYQYPLTPDSIVLEIGCYTGGWAKTMAEKYGCCVLTFEPIKRFYDQASLLFMLPPLSDLVRVENVGIGATTRKETFRIHGELSGVAADGESEEVQIVAVDEALRHDWVRDKVVGVLSINCEGGEYTILEALLDQGRISFFDAIQIQFHSVVPNAIARRDAIRNRLRITHRPAWELTDAMDNSWDGWEIAQ